MSISGVCLFFPQLALLNGILVKNQNFLVKSITKWDNQNFDWFDWSKSSDFRFSIRIFSQYWNEILIMWLVSDPKWDNFISEWLGKRIYR